MRSANKEELTAVSVPEPETISETAVPYRRKVPVVAATTLAVLGLGFGGAYAYASKLGTPDRVAPGIKIGELGIGGLTREEATRKANDWASERLQQSVTFTAPASGKKWAYTLADLGGKFDIGASVNQAFALGKDDNMFEKLYWGNRERDAAFAPSLSIDQKKIDDALKQIAAEVNRAPKNARASMDDKGGLVVSEHAVKGVTLDIATTKASLLKKGVQALADGEEAKVVIVEAKPKVTDAELGKIGTLMGSYSSDFGSSSSDRQHNIVLAASHINGTILGPDEEFSYNKIVGPREPGYGWRMGHAYSNGNVIDSLGGGVCQVSSTLYNAALYADIKITERRCHSSRVAYLPAGRDATVAWDSQDFRFKNNTDGPIYLAAKTRGGVLTFRIYGTGAPKRKIERIRVSGGSSGRSGGTYYSAWKVGKDENGKEFREEIGDSYYKPLKPREH